MRDLTAKLIAHPVWMRPDSRTGMRAVLVLAVACLVAGCSGGKTDLYDYLSSDSPSPSSNAPATAGGTLAAPPDNGSAQPANASANAGGLDNAEEALAAARPSNGIEKVSLKNAQGVAVTVDDLPITNFDVSQRINLENALGGNVGTDFETRKRVLGTLVNEKVAKSKAAKMNFSISDRQLEERIDGMVTRMKVSRDDLRKQLAQKGVDESALKTQIEGSLYIRWVMSQQQVDTDVKVDQAKVDAKLREIMNDPRMKPVTVVTVQQVDLPVEDPNSAMGQQLMYARAVEARQIMERYKGCKSLKSASADIFNVRVAKPVEADMSRLPKELQGALRKAGTKQLIGPIPGPGGIKLFANCGTRNIQPPAPDRSQIEASVRNQQFEELIATAMTEARKDAFVDYKDPAFRP